MPLDWQHPYVAVFKQFSHLVQKQGDCNECLDPLISKRCFKLQGAISANNYIEIPKRATAKQMAKGLGPGVGRFLINCERAGSWGRAF